jgi:NAD(P)-dependent dehydrogenase (short-subunit alcohol dehydrogenase family)
MTSNVVITGANRGIGLALANLYAGRGDRVFACCRAPSKAKDLAALAPSHALTVLPVDGPVRVLHALLPALKRAQRPKVMSITSQLGAISLDLALAYGYSSSKTALNKFMRLAAPELARHGVASGVIHPGWVQTDMGGANAQITPAESAAGIAAVIDRLSLDNSGGFWKWNGDRHDW